MNPFCDETIVQVLYRQLLLTAQLSNQPSFCTAITKTSCLKALQQLLFLITCWSLHPCSLTLSAQAMLHSLLHVITMCQSKYVLLDQGEHSTATALHSCSPQVLPMHSSWKQHCYLPRRKRECFSSDDSITSAWCSVTSRTCLPPKGTPPLPREAKAWNQRQRTHYSNVVRKFYSETW